MKRWLRVRWYALGRSYEPSEVSVPLPGKVAITAAMLTLFAIVGYVPSVAVVSRFERPWVSLLLGLVAGGLTIVASRKAVDSTVGQVSTLFDNFFYGASLTYAAVATRGDYALGFALLHALVMLSFPARHYGLTLLGVLALCGPSLLLVIAFRPAVAVQMVFVGMWSLTLLLMQVTSSRQRQRLGVAADAVTRSVLAGSSTVSTLEQGESSLQDMVGSTIASRWRLERLLGVGGMGAVFAARSQQGDKAAVKLLHPGTANEPRALTQLMREAQAARSIRSNQVARIYECCVDERGTPYLVMELLEGESLRERLERHRRGLPLDEVSGLALQLLQVIGKAHRQGIVHRDIKPSNLFLTTEGELKVLDFGLARLVSSRQGGGDATTETASIRFFGTPAYMPPEVARGRPDLVDERSDIWAIGATLFALLTGRAVHLGETANEVMGRAMVLPAPPTQSVRPDLSDEFSRIIDRALAFDRKGRWQSADEMRRAIAELSMRHQAFPAWPAAIAHGGVSG